MPARFFLIIIKGSGEGKTYSFDQQVINIGRTSGFNDVVLDDTSVSREHARVIFEGGAYFLKDLGSSNRTFFKGTLLEKNKEVELEHGDEFRLGKIELRFLIEKETASESDDQDDSEDTQRHTKRHAGDGSSLFNRKPIRIAGILFLALVVILVLFKVFSKPPPTPKPILKKMIYQPVKPVPLPAEGIYGYTQNKKTHPDKAIFTFFAESGIADLYYIPGGVDIDGEVVIILNGTKIANVPLAMEGWGKEQVFHISRALLVEDGENRLVFDNTLNPPGLNTWGVKNVRIEFISSSGCDDKEARRLFGLGEKCYEEKGVRDDNLYRACKYFTRTISLVDQCRPQPDFLPKAEVKLINARNELETRYKNLVFSYKKAIKIKKYGQVKNDLEEILRLIPDKNDKRHKETGRLLKKLNQALRRAGK